MEARTLESNSQSESDFSILATGHAFSVLSDRLYTDKPLAITRELWCNAYDSHCAAGKADVAFSVTLPDSFDPSYRVRDYGTGLTHSEVTELYTTFFKSTKTDDPTQIGKFGLGSKTPFSYTDTFSVTVWQEGEVRSYSAAVGPEGVPVIHHFDTRPSNEPTGLEVAFAVHSDDYWKFKEAARRIGLGFKTRPAICDQFTYPTPASEGDGWKRYDAQSNASVHMGTVIYAVDPEQFEGDVRYFLSTNIVINVPINAVEVTASREALSYGRYDATVPTISEICNRIMCENFEKASTHIHACKSRWEALCHLSTVRLCDLGQTLYTKLLSDGYKGIRLTKEIFLDYRHKQGVECFQFDTGTARIAPKDQLTVRVDPKIHFVFHDRRTSRKTTHLTMRLRQYSARNDAKIVGVTLNDPQRDIQEVHELMDLIDGAPIIATTDLPLRETTEPRAPTTTPRRNVPLRVYGGTKGFSPMLAATDELRAAGGIYVPIKNMSYRGPLALRDIRDGIMEYAGECPKIYGLPAYYAKWAEEPQWVTLDDYVSDFIDRFLKANPEPVLALEPHGHRPPEYAIVFTGTKLAQHNLAFGRGSPAMDVLRMARFLETARRNQRLIQSLRSSGRRIVCGFPDAAMKRSERVLDAFQTRYPLISGANNTLIAKVPEHCIHYIKLCDKEAR